MPRGRTLLLGGGAILTNATFTGQSLFADGSATLPSITFASNPNTGIYSAGLNSIGLAVQGAAQWNITTASLSPATDNTDTVGDSTHRASSIHTQSLTIGQTLANATIGEVTLSGSPPLAIIYSSAITATSTTRIFLTKCLQRPVGNGGAVAISTSIAGVSATVVSLSAGDTSVVNWWIVPTS